MSTTSSLFQGGLAGPGGKLSRPAVNLARAPQGLGLQSRSGWTAALTGRSLRAQVKPVSGPGLGLSRSFCLVPSLGPEISAQGRSWPPAVRRGRRAPLRFKPRPRRQCRSRRGLGPPDGRCSPSVSPGKSMQNCDVHKRPSLASLAGYRPRHGCSSYRHGAEGAPEACRQEPTRPHPSPSRPRAAGGGKGPGPPALHFSFPSTHRLPANLSSVPVHSRSPPPPAQTLKVFLLLL